jgi:tripartite-type tricarboxylate transporter receptor subunit TctC
LSLRIGLAQGPISPPRRWCARIASGLADPKIKARIADLGGTPLMLSPAAFGRFIADETEKWDKVVKFAGIKAE